MINHTVLSMDKFHPSRAPIWFPMRSRVIQIRVEVSPAHDSMCIFLPTVIVLASMGDVQCNTTLVSAHTLNDEKYPVCTAQQIYNTNKNRKPWLTN